MNLLVMVLLKTKPDHTTPYFVTGITGGGYVYYTCYIYIFYYTGETHEVFLTTLVDMQNYLGKINEKWTAIQILICKETFGPLP